MLPSASDRNLDSALQEPGGEVLVAANGYATRLFARAAEGETWQELRRNALDTDALAALKKAAGKGRVLWQDVKGELAVISPGSAAKRASVSVIAEWAKRREALTAPRSRREGEASARTRGEVAALAANRCQMCGDDLRAHVGATRGNFSYFAHIIASSPDGPRGSDKESTARADDPTNLLLLCDKCHRRIDRIEPNEWDAPRLFALRDRSIAMVTELLNKLKLPEARVLACVNSVEGQMPVFSRDQAERALWAAGLRRSQEPVEFFAKLGHLSGATNPATWASLAEQLGKSGISQLTTLLDSTRTAESPAHILAVFGLHAMSVLVLLGRLLGDSSDIRLFQRHRERERDHWSWPATSAPGLVVHAHRKGPKPTVGCEALLRVALTANNPLRDLPSSLVSGDEYTLPTIEITIDRPSPLCVSHEEVLSRVTARLREVTQELHDEWHVGRVHAVPVAPATVCIRLGQLLQARHHPEYLIYERDQASGAFEPVLRLHRTEAEFVKSSTGPIRL